MIRGARCTILCDMWQVGGYLLVLLVSSTNKTDCNSITEILLKVALNTTKQTQNRISIHVRTFQSFTLGTDHLNCRGEGDYVYFFSFRYFFSDNTRVRIFFFVAQSAKFFFQNLTLGYVTKTLNQIFFSSTKIRIFFSATTKNQNIFFLGKNHTPPPPFKLNGRSLNVLIFLFSFCRKRRSHFMQ